MSPACGAIGLAMLVTLSSLPARAEVHTIEVTSPATATLSGDLTVPPSTGPFPTVIVLHGCAGIGPNIKQWSRWLVHEGYAAFVLDSFSGRRIRRLCGIPIHSPDPCGPLTFTPRRSI